MIIKRYVYGDTAVYYTKEEIEGHDLETVGLALYPASATVPETLHTDSLVQVAFTGDRNLIDYTQGLSMRNRFSTVLSIVSQTAGEEGVVTVLSDGNGNEYEHTLSFDGATNVFSLSVRYTNRSQEIRTLEALDSFSVSGILSPSRNYASTCGFTLHRMTAAWSRECRLKSDSFSHLGLDMSWGRYGVKVEKFGERGSMPVRDYFPFAAIEDESGFILAAMAEAPYSWQMEVYQEKESCSLSGGLGDYEFAHWRKDILPGESFETDRAFLRVKEGGGVNGVCNDFLHFMDARLSVPASEEELPVLFNEYCTTWGTPSEENIRAILRAIEPLHLDYFVIDCGWYLPEHCGWCNSPGDWNESKRLFPHGIRSVVKAIEDAGLLPGIWFEFEVAGIDSKLYYETDYLLTRDGVPLSSKNRRFVDLRKENAQAYLKTKMLDFLKDNGFRYIKIDYNDNIGIGCDGAESLGEGGRQVVFVLGRARVPRDPHRCGERLPRGARAAGADLGGHPQDGHRKPYHLFHDGGDDRAHLHFGRHLAGFRGEDRSDRGGHPLLPRREGHRAARRYRKDRLHDGILPRAERTSDLSKAPGKPRAADRSQLRRRSVRGGHRRV